MTNSFTSNAILHYPTIEFNNPTWLKAAICFWDKIYRIVPAGYKPNDSGDVEIVVKNGVVEDIAVGIEDLEETCESFTVLLDRLQFIPSGFKSASYETHLHQDKVDERLRSFFKSFRGDADRQGFYRVPNNVANGYMFHLSDTVSKRRGIPKLTDDKDMFAAMSYIDVGGAMGEDLCDRDAKEVYSNLMLDYLLPSDIGNTPIEVILKRNEKLSSSKNEFRKLVSDFTDDLKKVKDVQFAKKKIVEFGIAITEQRKNYLDTIRTITKEFVPSVVYVGFPTMIQSLISTMSKCPDEVLFEQAIATGVTVGSVAAIGNVAKEVRKSWKKNASNYFIDICDKSNEKEEFKFRHWRMECLINEFVND